jgi:hypothetical protein
MPRARDDLDAVVLDGEAVLFDPQTATLHRLNPAATAVWSRCDGVTPCAVVVDDLADASAAPLERVRADVLDLLDDLGRRQLLVAPHPGR